MFLSPEIRTWLAGVEGAGVRFEEVMSRHTTFRVGGAAEIFAEPETLECLADLVRGFSKRKIPFYVIGGGSNILVRDEGIHGAVIRLNRCCRQIVAIPGDMARIEAGAGAMLHALVRCCRKNGWEGVEFLEGIPGTVGGAIRGNAGTAGRWISDVLDSIRIMTSTGETRELRSGQWKASYRHLTVECEAAVSGPMVFLSGKFRVAPGNPEKLAAESIRLRRLRQLSQPVGQPSAGCVFRNPSPESPAGMLIDQAGLKGLTVGGARVSEKHANFIVTSRNARASDILFLMEEIRRRVEKRFHILLENELIVL